MAGDLPADDHPGEHVDQEREVHPPLPRAQVREVADPQAVQSVGREVALYEIGTLLGVWISDGGPPWLAAPLRAPDALLAHQPCDSVTADLLALALQLVPHARIAVALEVLLVHFSDPGEEPLILDPAWRPLTRRSLVVRRRRDVQSPADRLDPVASARLIDERAHDGRFGSSSLAK